MTTKYGFTGDFIHGVVPGDPVRDILSEDDPDYWIKLGKHIAGSQLDNTLHFWNLNDENSALQRTPINLKYLLHTMQLRLTEGLAMVTRALYERGLITLDQHRTSLNDVVGRDQGIGRNVGRVTRTRLGTQPIVPGELTPDGFIPSDQIDAMGRIVGIHSVSYSCTLPLHFSEPAPSCRLP
jgi:hypothetical protein